MADNSWWDNVSTGFSNFTDGIGDLFNIGSTVSPSSNMKADDVLKTKSALNAVGSYKLPDFGITDIPDTGMIDGLKTFQANNGLKVDGIMKPGGPTENALGQTLANQGISTSDLLAKAKTPNVTPKPVLTPPQTSWSASVPFGDAPQPKKPELPKIDPMTGLSVPLANTPKGKMPTKKQQQKASSAIIPQGGTVDQHIRSMMTDRRYNDKTDTRLRDHVQKQFENAYPGNVEYDETGKMVQPTAAIRPQDVQPFDPDGELIGYRGNNILVGGSGVDDLSGESQAMSLDNHHADFKGIPERPTHYSEQTEKAIREKRYNGFEEEAFADMQNILMKDPDGFKNFSQEDIAAYQAYQTKRRQHWRPGRTGDDQAQVKRNAIEVSREAGSGSYIIPEAKRAFWKNATDAAHGAVAISSGNQEQIDAIKKTRQRKMDENPVPDIYKGRTIGKYTDDIVNFHPLQGALSGAGKAAKDLEKMGVSKEGQQIGAVIIGLVGIGGTSGAKFGAGEIKDYLAKKFGKNWSKRLMPKDVEVLNDQLIGQGLQVGTSAGIKAAADGNKPTRRKR